MRDHIKNITIVVLLGALGFVAGYILATYTTLNWIVDTLIKMLNSDNGAVILNDLLKLHSASDPSIYFNGTALP